MQYTVQDWKDGKVVIDYLTEKNTSKLQQIIKTAYPNSIDSPSGVGEIYWSSGHRWECDFDGMFPKVPRCTVDDIILPATATKQEK